MADDIALPERLERPVQTFSSRAVEVLREMILSGQLRHGQRLNEVELADALGISRGPLREAIQRLRSESLLTSVPGRGAFVRTFTPASLRELYEVRIALETHALRLVGEHPSPEGIEELLQLLEQTSDALIDGQDYPLAMDFHHQIVALADNQALLEAVTDVHRQIHLARTWSGWGHVRARIVFDVHKEILEHLANGRSDQAADLLATHLQDSLQSALAVLQFDSSTAEAPILVGSETLAGPTEGTAKDG